MDTKSSNFQTYHIEYGSYYQNIKFGDQERLCICLVKQIGQTVQEPKDSHTEFQLPFSAKNNGTDFPLVYRIDISIHT